MTMLYNRPDCDAVVGGYIHDHFPDVFGLSVLRYDKFDSLSLHLPPLELGRVQHTLTQLLDRFVKTEVVGGVSCEGCNKSTPPEGPQIKSTALKSLSIGKLPRCLCIHIPRTLIHNGEPYKRQDYVDFPEFLGMDPYTQYNLRDLNAEFSQEKLLKEKFGGNPLKKQPLLELSKNDGDKNLEASLNNIKSRKMNLVYRIKAVIVHKGSLKGGHFVTYRRGPLKSHKRHRLNQTHQSHGERRWYLTSDADVRDATLSEALQSTAYMLFYEKCYQESSVTWSSVSLRTS
ncbi:ubiquitin carboxyl-terminal hydrolase 30 homolog [Lycorma delicatula]|uniref:ubiquitin carboxyl-terminal hydrolase 30 homolog n=1 Tax=Lycorma delicatula TaxID=130591 RepID=UPI003F50ED91